jgi:hypothetical protein
MRATQVTPALKDKISRGDAEGELNFAKSA